MAREHSNRHGAWKMFTILVSYVWQLNRRVECLHQNWCNQSQLCFLEQIQGPRKPVVPWASFCHKCFHEVYSKSSMLPLISQVSEVHVRGQSYHCILLIKDTLDLLALECLIFADRLTKKLVQLFIIC